MRIRIAAIATAALVAATLAAPATAGNEVRFETQLRLSPFTPAFHGGVHSENPACEENRRVKMFRKRFGPDRLLGVDESNADGRWRVIVDIVRTSAYYAKVVRREEGTAGTTFVCKRDRSKTLIVD